MFKCKSFFFSPTDGAPDRICHLGTAVLLFSAAVITYHRSNSAPLIQCQPPAGIEHTLLPMQMLEYIEHACSVQPLVSYDSSRAFKASPIAHHQPDYMLEWVPYVPYVLALATLLALLPNLLRLTCCPCTAVDFDHVRTMAKGDPHRLSSLIADRILSRKLSYVQPRRSSGCRGITVGPLVAHFVLKFCSMASLIVILRLLTTVFPMAGDPSIFEALGSVLSAAVSGSRSREEPFVLRRLFPTDFVCWVARPSLPGGKSQPPHDYHCVFAANSLHGSLHLVLSLWTIVALVCQSLSIISWAIALFVGPVRRGAIELALETRHIPPRVVCPRKPCSTGRSLLDDRFHYSIMTPDTMFVLYQVKAYFGHTVSEEIVRKLFDGYRAIEERLNTVRMSQIEVVV